MGTGKFMEFSLFKVAIFVFETIFLVFLHFIEAHILLFKIRPKIYFFSKMFASANREIVPV